MAVTLAAVGEPVAASRLPADHLPLTLSWGAPDGCPTADAEREEILRRTGSVAPDRARQRNVIVAEVAIRRSGSTFELSLHTKVGDTEGERILSGPDCRQLADAAALVLALLVNPDASLAPQPPVPAPQPEVARPSGASAASPPPVEEPTFAAGLGAVAALRVLPGVADGLDLRFVGRRGRWAAVARAAGFLAKETDAPILPGARASFYRLEGALAGCALAGNRVGGSVCVGGAVVRLHGESAGVSNPGGGSAFWLEALAEVSGYLRTGQHGRLRLSLEGRGLGSPPDFAIVGLGSVYRAPATSLRGAFALDWLF